MTTSRIFSTKKFTTEQTAAYEALALTKDEMNLLQTGHPGINTSFAQLAAVSPSAEDVAAMLENHKLGVFGAALRCAYLNPESGFIVSEVAIEATRVLPKGAETHPAITHEATVQQFIRASIAIGFVSVADVAADRVEVTVEAREDREEPLDVYVFLNGTDCIFFEPIH